MAMNKGKSGLSLYFHGLITEKVGIYFDNCVCGTGLLVLPSAVIWCCSAPWHVFWGVWADTSWTPPLLVLSQNWWGGLAAERGQRSNC